MPTICLKVSNEVKELWVERANGEGVSLSEWLRSAAELKLQSAQPYVAKPAWEEEEVESAFKEYLRESGATGTAIENGPRSGQPGAPGNTEERGAEEPGAPDTDTAPSDDAGASESSASAPPPETEEEDTARSPQVVDPGSGSTPASPNEPAASVSDKLAEAREALGRPFKGPDFRPEKKKKR